MAYRDTLDRKHEGGAGGDGAEPTGAEPTDAPAKQRRRIRAGRLVVGAVALAALGFGGVEAADWWANGRFLISTDDAYVEADVTPLSAKVAGYVAALPVAENAAVEAGAVVARIDPEDYRIARDAAAAKRATQEAAIARIDRQRVAARAGIRQAQAELDATRAEADRAEADFDRQQSLAREDFASRAALDAATAGLARARAAVEGAQARLEAARAEVDVLSAQEDEARRVADELALAVEKAERDLAFTEIRAPVAGVIGNRAAELGALVQPGSRIAALVPLRSAHVVANFKETEIADLAPGQPVEITVDAYPDRVFEGRVESLAPASGAVFSLLPPDNATGNFTKIVQRVPVRIALPEDAVADGLFRPGLSVVVSVDPREGAVER